MAEKIAVNRVIHILPTDPNTFGMLWVLGDASDGAVSTITIDVVPGAGFGGSAPIVGRSREWLAASPAAQAAVPWTQVPYLALVYANTAQAPPAFHAGTVSGRTIAEIPATGLMIGIDCSGMTGEAWILWTPTVGAAA